MVHLYRTPGERSVAGVTRLSGRNMRARQADGTHGVVTARAAVRDHARVVEARRRPRVGGVAEFAGGIRRQVPRGLRARDGAVVTGRARAEHLGMVDARDRQPRKCRMTALASVAGRHVVGWLAAA